MASDNAPNGSYLNWPNINDVGGLGNAFNLGPDAYALNTAAQAVGRDLRTITGLGTITSSAALVRPEIIVKPDFESAADLGVTSSDIAQQLD